MRHWPMGTALLEVIGPAGRVEGVGAPSGRAAVAKFYCVRVLFAVCWEHVIVPASGLVVLPVRWSYRVN